MSDNILQKSLAVTYEDFLKGVFGKKEKPEWRALTTLFSEIVTGRSTLVSDLSKPLRENASLSECKRVQERVSGWLANYDFVEETGGWLENIFSLCVLAYCYATQSLRKSKGFKKILKFLSDNLEKVSMRTRALLAGIRALVNEAHLRFISGRPRKRHKEDDRQLMLAGF